MSKTLQKKFSMKTLHIDADHDQREDICDYFLRTFNLYERLFQFVKEDRSYYIKHEPLRHPLIFYYGHTATFFINKFLDAKIIQKRINEKFQFMFAVGVDQMDWDDLNETHYDWPTVQEVKEYRKKIKEMVIECIKTMDKIISWNSPLWIVLMGIEHERIHLETSAAIIRRLPIQDINPSIDFIDCPQGQTNIEKIPFNQLVKVNDYHHTWERKIQNPQTYGWDNEFGEKEISLKEFQASSMLVSNGQYFQFVADNGYHQEKYWSSEGIAWLKSTKTNHPIFWFSKESGGGLYMLRTMNTVREMPWDWPVEVNNLQAQAFCSWKSEKTGKNIRLPSEDEYYAIRSILKTDQPNWQYQSVGNINLEYWFSPNPINRFKTGNFYDIVGNVWQHTITPIYPFNKFQIHPTYEDFTTPTFDNRHNLIKGGSFVSTGNQALFHSRYAFRRHFYQFAGFRYVVSSNQDIIEGNTEQSDLLVEKALFDHYQNQQSYIQKSIYYMNKLFQMNNHKCNKALSVGCSVGRIPFQLTKKFTNSYGIDYTARFFQMATKITQTGSLKYKNVNVSLENLNIKQKNIILYQFNPQNPDPKKLNNFDFIFVDGCSLRQNTLNKVLEKVEPLLTEEECLVMVIEDLTKNQLKKEFLKSNWKEVSDINLNRETMINKEFKFHSFMVEKKILV